MASGTDRLSRRALFALAPLAGLAACRRRSATGYAGFALITIAAENSLAMVNLNTFQSAGRRDFKLPPSAIVSHGDTAYVLTPADGTVHAVNPNRAGLRQAVRLSSHLDLLRLAPLDRQLVAVSSAGRELILADLPTLKPAKRVPLSASAIAMDVGSHSLSRRTYAALSGGATGTVETVDLQSGQRRKRELEGELGALRFRDDGQLLFVTNCARQSLVVLDTESLETVCELALPMKPQNLAFGAQHGQLFISGPGMDGVSIVYVYKTIEVDQTVLAARQPGTMACSDSPRYLFVASQAGSEITILNVDSRKMVALSLAGNKPSRIVITPDQQYALVLNEGSGDLAVIRIPEIQGSRTRNGAASMPAGILTLRGVSLFAMIPLGERPVDIALADLTA